MSWSRWMASYYPHPLDVDDVLGLTGTDSFAKQWTTKLSGGQAQRVRFAGGIVGDPDLLVLDEPTSAIDVEGRHEFWQAMRAMAERGKTILFATHYLEEADAFADRILIMTRGRIVAGRVGHRDQGPGRAGHDPSNAARRQPGHAGGAAGGGERHRHGNTVILSCSDPDAALEALYRAFQGIRDVEVRGGSLEEAFMELTAPGRPVTKPAVTEPAATERRQPDERRHARALRDPANLPQPEVPWLHPGVAARAVLRRGRGESSRARRRDLVPAVFHGRHGRLRGHVRRGPAWGADCPRPVQGLDPSAAYHTASGPHLLRRQGARRLPGRAGEPGPRCSWPARPLGCT